MDNSETLLRTAWKVRKNIVDMIYFADSGHLGGSLSVTDIIVMLLFEIMHINPDDPGLPDRDRLILSKGHAAPALYAALAERGFFPVEELHTLRKMGSRLQGHPDMTKTPGVDFTSGSLGNGLGIANGLGLAAKITGSKYRTFVVLGDGELQEGTVWESALTASACGLDNVVAVIDCNKLQVEGEVDAIKRIEPVSEKWEAFGWKTETIDGHDPEDLRRVLSSGNQTKGKPLAVIANTVKGKGVSFMENRVDYHKGYLNEELFKRAISEIDLGLEGVNPNAS